MNKFILSFAYSIFIAVFSISADPIAIQKENKIPNRELIVFLENLNHENIENTLQTPLKDQRPHPPCGINASTITLLLALHQESAPILVSNVLVKNILDHKALFHDFITLSLQELNNKYGKYRYFNDKKMIKNFKHHATYVDKMLKSINQQLKVAEKKKEIDNIVKKIKDCTEFNEFNAPLGLRMSSNQHKMRFEMTIYAICELAPLGTENWIIKKVNSDLCLLIPKKYLEKIKLDNGNFSKTSTDNKIVTELEKNFGLMVNHLADITDITELKKAQTSNSDYKENSFVDSLTHLFVLSDKNTDAKTQADKEKPKTIWAIYIAAHGFPESPAIAVYNQLKKLEELYSEKLKINSRSNTKDKKEYNSDKYNLKMIQKELAKTEKHLKSLKLDGKGIIISLSKQEFQKLLEFFNNSIETAFLFYTSCYAGGKFLVEPYIKNQKPLILNYTVVSGTLAENMSMQEMPILKLPPYYAPANNKKKSRTPHISNVDIHFEKRNLKVRTTLNFDRFFDALHEGYHLDEHKYHDLISYLHPYSTKSGQLKFHNIGNIPVFRKAGTDAFRVVPNIPCSETITPEYLKKNQKNKIESDANLLLLYADHIPNSVILGKDECVFISMLPDLSAHTFDEIYTTKFNLAEIINSFLAFPELGSSKIFWIKNLTCKNTPEITNFFNIKKQKTVKLKDVIIMRNIFNTDAIPYCKPDRNTPLNTCAYISLPGQSESYRVMWRGPELQPNNIEIAPCETKNYQNDLIAFCPAIEKHIKKDSQAVVA